MSKSKLKDSFLNFILFLMSMLVTFLILNFILIKITPQKIFPRPLAGSLPNTLLTFYPDTYSKKNMQNYTAVLGNSAAQGNGDAYLGGLDNYSISHHLHDKNKENYLIFGRAGFHSIYAVVNLIKVHRFSNDSFMIKNLNKPKSIIFFFYEGTNLVWNYEKYKRNVKKNENISSYTSRQINKNLKTTFLEKLCNHFPLLPFLGAFLEDFGKLFNETSSSKNFKEVLSSITNRIKKLFGFYIVLNDRKENNLTWTNSLSDHKNIKNIRPIQGASETLNKDQILIGLEIFYESLKQAKSWSNAKNIQIIYIPSAITVYNWNEPIIYGFQALSPKSKDEVKSTTNKENSLKNIFIRKEIENFSKKNNIIFLDPSDILFEKGKNKVLHGPLDWGHLNYEGYKVVSDFIIEETFKK
jgi:hypothetical protein|tara:strand:+ start:1408 stop:2640 length:1233 start_codon:yes stop_codon:yes gene_type:complete